MSINVAIVENDEEAADVLARQIEATAGFRCTGIYANLAAALDQLVHSRSDVVLVDIQLPGVKGVEGVRRIKETCPSQNILVLTNLDDPQIVFSPVPLVHGH